MMSLHQPTPDLPAAIAPGPSPLWPRHLVDLFFRPTKFFQSQLALGRTPYVLLVTWAVGSSAVIDQINTQIVQAALYESPERWQGLELLIGTWPKMWAIVLLLGAVSGALYWWIGGWWCRVRLAWSGAPSPNPRLARLLLIYSSFVYAGPAVLVLLATTASYSNYLEASQHDTLFSAIAIVAMFWSVGTTYKGALALFPVASSRARLWFLVLPAVFFFLAMGGLAALSAAAA